MALIMTKYEFDEKDYLIYDKNILSRDFTSQQWAVIADSESGVGANYIIELSGSDVKCYNKYGIAVEADEKCWAVAADYLHQSSQPVDARRIEVRFTDSFINRLVCSFSQSKMRKAYIA